MQYRLIKTNRPCSFEIEYHFEIAQDFDFSNVIFLVMEVPEREFSPYELKPPYGRCPRLFRRFHPAHPAEDLGYEPLSDDDEEVDVNARKRAWARLLAKGYEVDPFVCPKCGAGMKVIAIIEDPDKLKRILRHLIKIARPPSNSRRRQRYRPAKLDRRCVFTKSLPGWGCARR